MTATKTTTGKTTPRRWSAGRRRLFLKTLALTSNVSASERAAAMPPRSAYKERGRDPEFRAAWDGALREGYDRLEMELLNRALKGKRKAVRDKASGEIVGYDTEFSERLALTLLNAHRASVKGGAAPAESSDPVEVRKRILAKIADVRRKLGDA